MNIIPKSELENFIQVFDNVLSIEKCKFILDEYIDSEYWKNSLIQSNQLNTSIRNCSLIPISDHYTIEKNSKIRKNIDEIIYKSVNHITDKYCNIFPTLNIQIDTGYDLLRYKIGQFYTEHVDSFKEFPRTLSCSILLNDDYEGGEFSFFGGDLKIKSKAGSAIVFPSNFMFPHGVMPVIKGTRYSIVTWLI